MSRSPRPPGLDGPAAIVRWKSNSALFAAGGASIVAGGLVAAVTGPTKWAHGSWVAAFLVLVAGVAQIGVAAGQAHFARHATTVAFTAMECVLFNASCMTVIAGTLLSTPLLVTIGSVPLVAALGMSMFSVRGSGGQPPLLLWLYRVLLAVVLISIPIGSVLAWTRH